MGVDWATVVLIGFTLSRRLLYIFVSIATLLSYLWMRENDFVNVSHDYKVAYDAIVFLKTHKTGGSTLTNVLQRFAEYHNLKVALPNKTYGQLRYNYFGDVGESLSRDHIYDPHGNTTFDILCNHVIFSAAEFRRVFKRRTFYLTILREPVSNVLSAVNYFGLTDGYIQRLLMETNTSVFKYLPRYEPKNVYLSFTNNRQLFDLGFPPWKIPRNMIYVRQFIRELENNFQFVMIMEYFDESLIIVKRLLNWTFKDILYIPQNKGREKLVADLTDIDRADIFNWNRGDGVLYSHFLRRLLKEINKRGPGLKDEVSVFRRILRKVWDFCDLDEQDVSLTIDRTPWDPGFMYRYDECGLLRLNELQYLERLYKYANR